MITPFTCTTFLAVGFLAISDANAATSYVEGAGNDLSDDYLNPTPLVFTSGSNIVVGSLAGFANDLDLFTFTVLPGHTLTNIFVIEFSGGNSGSSFAMQAGNQLSSDPVVATANRSFPHPIANALITPALANVDFDILPNLVVGPPFNFSNPLPAGEYVVWLNETDSPSSYTLDFTVVPEPASTTLLAGALSLSLFFRRK